MKDKEQHLLEFQENVEWLKKIVPPEEIYEFAEQALMAADYFLSRWSDWVDIEEEAKEKVAGKWLQNIVGLRMLKNMNYDGSLNIKMKMPEEL